MSTSSRRGRVHARVGWWRLETKFKRSKLHVTKSVPRFRLNQRHPTLRTRCGHLRYDAARDRPIDAPSRDPRGPLRRGQGSCPGHSFAYCVSHHRERKDCGWPGCRDEAANASERLETSPGSTAHAAAAAGTVSSVHELSGRRKFDLTHCSRKGAISCSSPNHRLCTPSCCIEVREPSDRARSGESCTTTRLLALCGRADTRGTANRWRLVMLYLACC